MFSLVDISCVGLLSGSFLLTTATAASCLKKKTRKRGAMKIVLRDKRREDRRRIVVSKQSKPTLRVFEAFPTIVNSNSNLEKIVVHSFTLLHLLLLLCYLGRVGMVTTC